MTAPTQAQIIEALNIGKAACLIACALEPIRDNWTKWENAADIIDKQIATLTAAAEVGPDEYSQGFQHGFAGYEEAIAATIERCAQWLEDHYPSARTIAFEMRRALKDTKE